MTKGSQVHTPKTEIGPGTEPGGGDSAQFPTGYVPLLPVVLHQRTHRAGTGGGRGLL